MPLERDGIASRGPLIAWSGKISITVPDTTATVFVDVEMRGDTAVASQFIGCLPFDISIHAVKFKLSLVAKMMPCTHKIDIVGRNPPATSQIWIWAQELARAQEVAVAPARPGFSLLVLPSSAGQLACCLVPLSQILGTA
jgi:hypothetical protein